MKPFWHWEPLTQEWFPACPTLNPHGGANENPQPHRCPGLRYHQQRRVRHALSGGHESHRRRSGQKPNISAEQLAQVKQYRAEGEALHKAGKHQESVDTLAKAKKILGIQ
jgi:hypothetical protein